MNNDSVKKTPDVLGMKMPAAIRILDAAGISYHKEILEPLKKQEACGSASPFRVVRQQVREDGSVVLSLCRVPDVR